MTLNPDPTPGPGPGPFRIAREKLEIVQHLLEEVQIVLREFGGILDEQEGKTKRKPPAKGKKTGRK